MCVGDGQEVGLLMIADDALFSSKPRGRESESVRVCESVRESVRDEKRRKMKKSGFVFIFLMHVWCHLMYTPNTRTHSLLPWAAEGSRKNPFV